MKVHLTGTNLERPTVYNWRASRISHVMTSCSATCRVTSAMYSHHRVSKPDSDTAQCGRQKAILSLFLSWDCRSRYVNRSSCTFFIESKEFVFIYRIWPSMCLLAAREASSEFKRLRNYESSGTIRFICITRDANEEKTGIGANAGSTNGYFPRNWTIAFVVDYSDPVFRITLMNLEPDLWI